jgi:outer membrane protein TolC
MLGLDVFQPLFNAGKNRANLSAKEEQAYQAGLNYQKVVLQALKEVSDEMRAFQSSSDNFEAQRSLVMSTREYFRLAQLRYRNGVSSSLDLMDAQRQLFSAEKALASAQLQRLESMTRLYRALAGGWYASSQTAS